MTGAILALLLAGPAAATPDNPHGRAEACDACHLPGEEAEGTLRGPVVETCRSCHPTADMHPVGMPSRDVPVPHDWPLEGGEVTCATCHAEPAHREVPAIGELAAYAARYWHRGGPYERVTTFCFRCHEESGFARTDPHHPVADDPRPDRDPSCAACHTGLPEPGASPAEAKLRASPERACATCHQGDVHHGASAHVGQALVAEVRAGLPEDLPLHDGTVACWTCHDVHQGGEAGDLQSRLGVALQALHRKEWAVGEEVTWPGESRAGHPPLLALPLEGDALCSACHGAGP